MEDIKFLISGIEYKVVKLLQKHRASTAEVELLRSENQKLRNKLLESESRVQSLQEEVNKIKFARAEESGNEAREIKRKIDLLVHDLDKCIKVLEN